MKNMFGQLFQSLSGDVQVITSSMSRAEDEVLRFQKESEPRIALSVGMLDTGVDIPENPNNTSTTYSMPLCKRHSKES